MVMNVIAGMKKIKTLQCFRLIFGTFTIAQCPRKNRYLHYNKGVRYKGDRKERQ